MNGERPYVGIRASAICRKKYEWKKTHEKKIFSREKNHETSILTKKSLCGMVYSEQPPPPPNFAVEAFTGGALGPFLMFGFGFEVIWNLVTKRCGIRNVSFIFKNFDIFFFY